MAENSGFFGFDEVGRHSDEVALETGHREILPATYRPQCGHPYAAGDAGCILEVGFPVDENSCIFLHVDNIGARHCGISTSTANGEVGNLQAGVSIPWDRLRLAAVQINR